MDTTLFHIKNMVCNRCIEAVNEEFDRVNLPVKSISLGQVVLEETPQPQQVAALKKSLQDRGFELLTDQKSKVIEKIKTLIIALIHHNQKELNVNISTYLAKEIGQEYSSLSRLFSSVEGVTIERYVLKQKIEKVKEYIIYNELNLSEIAYQMNYSSVAHLSSQFKKETGMTPSAFKKSTRQNRKSIDAL